MESDKSQEAHMKKRIVRVISVMGQLWKIGKRRFGKNLTRRIWLAYGVKI